MKERHTKIIELISEQKRMEVAALSELLHTSKVTIRKDLDYLSEKGILRRERGYAVLVDPNDIHYHMAFAYKRKQSIARAAVSLVSDGETVMIESGSCCMIFAEELAHTRKGITILTNSAYLASYIRQYPVQVVLFGGDYQPQVQAMVGPLTKLCAGQYQVDKIFVGTDGFSSTQGFTGSNLIRVDTVRTMTQSARNIIVLTESEKFTRKGTVSFLSLDQVDCIITDSRLSKEDQAILNNSSARLILVN